MIVTSGKYLRKLTVALTAALIALLFARLVLRTGKPGPSLALPDSEYHSAGSITVTDKDKNRSLLFETKQTTLVVVGEHGGHADPSVWGHDPAVISTTAMQAAKLDLPVCRYPSPVLKGEVKPVSGSRVLTDLDEDQLEVKLEGLLPGGCWRPLGCRARNGSVAVIIPSHGRRGQLLTLLLYLVPLLQRQQQDFCIYTGNQSRTSAGERFNKGAIVDALFTEAMKERNWTCVCIHDVDLIPENDYNSYSCPHTHVRNLMAGLSKWDYQLAYPQVFGGCTVSMSWHFRLYNGLSTVFWGWGSEDDDHRRRLTWAGLTWQRSALDVGRFTHIQHRQSATNPDRFALVPRAEQLQKTHGLNSLKYSVMHRQSRRLYSAFVFHLPNQGP